MVPEISVKELAEKLRSGDAFVLFDVREPDELELASLKDTRLVVQSMSELAQLGLQGLPQQLRDPQAEVFVLCHHGIRSTQVTRWLASQGCSRVFSVKGGIDEYARQVDPSVGTY